MQLTIKIVLTERKTSLITVFPQLSQKKKKQKRLETFESEKGKVISSNFHEKFNFERKLERTRARIKIMPSASSS